MASLRDAAAAEDAPLVFLHSEDIFRFERTKVSIEPKALKVIKASRHPVLSMVGGNGHNSFGLIDFDPPLDFIHPDFPDRHGQPKARMTPMVQVSKAIARKAPKWLRAFEALCTALPDRVIQLGSPPPIGDDDWLAHRLKGKMRQAGVKSYSVMPAGMRYKMWRLDDAMYREIGGRHGASYLAAPEAGADADGYLKTEYWRDPTHANTDYGRLWLDTLRQADVPPL